MKRLLTYGLLLLTILASHFVVSACQDDLPETTEVMMTFTTRAVVTQNNESDVINEEKMKNLRVIMVREDGTIAYKEVKEINGSSVTVTFNTPVKTGGENFQFFAIANEDGILPAQNLGSIQSGDIEDLKNRVVGSESEFTIRNAIPQTKYWTAKVNPYESLSVSQQLDYLVSKISVQFKNETNKAQSLSNIHITGITPNGKGRLFNHPTGEKDNEGKEIYDEVYVTTNDVTLNNGIVFNGVTNLPSGESSAIQHYYTYPVDNGNISSPTLYAKWGDEVEPRKLELTGFTELKRNDHLKILITLTDVGIKVTYTIADWEENTTTIGGVNPTLGDSYMVKDWVQGDDVVIGEEPVEPEGPVTVEGLTISANPATIDLASSTTTTLTIYKPANITAITITPSINSAFTGLSNQSSGSITDYFKITGLSNDAGTVTVTLTANSNAATGSYTLTASGTGGDDYISNEATTTITLSKTQSGGGGEVTVWGDKDGEGAQEINWSEDKKLVVDLDWLVNAASVTGPEDKTGIQMYVYFTGNGGVMEIRQGTTTSSYSSLYINGTKTSYLDSMGSEKVSIFIPNEVKDTRFNFSGQNYTITKITVVK